MIIRVNTKITQKELQELDEQIRKLTKKSEYFILPSNKVEVIPFNETIEIEQIIQEMILNIKHQRHRNTQ